ncbi:hypothetical protein ETH_00013315 [Eimeria tenella]|uniref:Uncharacterized protein n=1 Tax=Eimeria tenella TaxID=5802 RepID=U6KGP0_EIMTE|nr:hypothetical protein ETH_00013315 [Eimeria tenella]CDJ37205.1 hypothetical protein ETH_00013315 [Eimeria tenella]|eukprot:XP_013228043.1 hypothetical protein ETH_00013315 [Eimeria tenella]
MEFEFQLLRLDLPPPQLLAGSRWRDSKNGEEGIEFKKKKEKEYWSLD